MNSISYDIVDNTANVLLENVKAGFNYDIYCVTVSSSGARMNYNTMINNKITISTTGTRKIYVELLKNGVISSQNKKNVLHLSIDALHSVDVVLTIRAIKMDGQQSNYFSRRGII